ncbi:MAG TPA: hypothetical protein DIU09_01825 [Hyphomonadaceae bacterium]|nr:hypothetical protein AEM38_03065 [Hyphomonadaceae bacterium UKL13-1]HCP63306.1 hypothetical protein [Hyphomonadaceae bacterium]
MFRPEMRQRLTQAGHLLQRQNENKLNELLEQIETNAVDFSSGSEAYKALAKYFTPKGGAHKPSIRQRLIDMGKLKPRAKRAQKAV